MPRPKGTKKEKVCSSLQNANDLFNDETNCLKNSISSKLSKSKKLDSINLPEDPFSFNLSPKSSSSDSNTTRVVINPAVLRYLEQNRQQINNNETFTEKFNVDIQDDFFNVLIPMSSQDFESFEKEKYIDDELDWDFSKCSTDFLPSARLAEWILRNPQRSRFQSIVTRSSVQ